MSLKVIIPIALVFVLRCFSSSQAEPEAPSCRDLRDEQNELACNRKAYRAWLSAGKELSNLGNICLDDLVELPKKCNMTADFEEKLILSEQHMNRPLLNALKEYLNEPVIELYMEEHPEEPALHLGNRKGGNCCQSTDDSPMKNVTNHLIEYRIGSYLKYLGGDGANPYEADFEMLKNAIYLLLSDHVFKPCGRYLHLQDDMFLGQLKGSVQKFMNNNWDFLNEQSKEFRAAVFRYQYCSNPDLVTRMFDETYDFWDQDDFQEGWFKWVDGADTPIDTSNWMATDYWSDSDASESQSERVADK